MSGQVIDLTASSPISKPQDPIIVLDSGDEEPSQPKKNGKDGNAKRRKRKKKTGITVTGADSGSSTPVPKTTHGGDKQNRAQMEEGEIQDEPSHSRRHRSRSPTAVLFYEDFGSAPVPSHATTNTPIPSTSTTTMDLLLPSHVAVFGAPVEIIPTIPSNSDDDEFIEFLDTDDRKGMARYFDEPQDEDAENASKRRIICRNCHEEGHIQAECRTQTCLTCGAKNEHSTYSCPINKVCFNCGMKGHLSNQCQQVRGYAQRNSSDCYRCGDEGHQSNECPSLWRIYHYLTVEESTQVLESRKARSELKLGEGGEGYIATDEWCYNCGESGHWGDDCGVQHPRDHPSAPSAFGLFNVTQGPFASMNGTDSVRYLAMKRKPRDWENESLLPADWGAGAPGNVGKLGRKKERERLAKRHRQHDEDEDDDAGDFFSRLSSQNNSLRIKGSAKSSSSVPKGPKAMRFNLPNKPDHPRSPPSLLQRLSTSDRDRERDRDRDRRGEYRDGGSSRRSSHRRDRSRSRDRGHRGDTRKERDSSDRRRNSDTKDKHPGSSNRDRESSRFGPQYKGGYSRSY